MPQIDFNIAAQVGANVATADGTLHLTIALSADQALALRAFLTSHIEDFISPGGTTLPVLEIPHEVDLMRPDASEIRTRRLKPFKWPRRKEQQG